MGGLDQPERLAPAASATHLVLIPSYNPGRKVFETVRAARAQWTPVWIIVDGSTDGTAEDLARLGASDSGLRVLRLPRNCGKGAALAHGLELAAEAGYTHALTLDSDGQHPTHLIRLFMAASAKNPAAMILGEPQFDASAPRVRVVGRRLCNWWVNVETLGAGIHDSLFGFRIYPIAPLLEIMRRRRWMRRFDFDAEAAVRLCWGGVRPLNIAAPVRYFTKAQGGVTHFRYGRDNALLTWMHLRLLAEFVLRLPLLWVRRRRAARLAPAPVLPDPAARAAVRESHAESDPEQAPRSVVEAARERRIERRRHLR
jgi:glycosyltransferase involved in cell wall biosynthesis